MINRCETRSNPSYRRYGGRGIKVGSEWRADFKAFYDWALSSGWKPGLILDRVDNDGDYTRQNCRWVNGRTSTNNRGVTARLTAWGETKSLSDWLLDTRTHPQLTWYCLYDRMELDWPPEEKLTRPPKSFKRLVTAWGETKTVAEWLNDPRCQVKQCALYVRLGKGIPPEQALAA